MQEAALVFSASNNSHEEIEAAEKKAMYFISKGDTDNSFNYLCHKKRTWKVTTMKSLAKPEKLPPTYSDSMYHSFQTHF